MKGKKQVTSIMLYVSPFLAGVSLLSCNVNTEKPNVLNKEKFNILLIFADDLNDWNSVLGGHPQVITPNISKFAGNSIVFTNGHCPAPLSNASRTSIFTGYTPVTTGVYDNSTWFRESSPVKDCITLPQYFATSGYQTAAAGKIFHLPRGPLPEPNKMSDDISWQYQWVGDVGCSPPVPMPDQELNIPPTDYFGKSFLWGPSPEPKEETSDYKLSKYCADFLLEKHDKPFMLACGIFRPHLSWFVPQEFFDMYNLGTLKLPAVLENDQDDLPEAAKKMIKPLVHDELLRTGKWDEAVRAYLASITFADYCIGVVLDALEKSEYKDNTIVIIMGDNGYHLGEKKHWTKFTLWERSTRITYMMRVPGCKPGSTDSPVSLLDIYPTLVDLCGLPEKADLEGRSLTPLLNDLSVKWDYPAVTYFVNENTYSLRDKRWRYIHYGDGTEELYDHVSDPNEWYNIASAPENVKIIEGIKSKAGIK